ncbi:MAG: hypothetical protein WDO17_14810 [Alphaproteobacteria bacterium]
MGNPDDPASKFMDQVAVIWSAPRPFLVALATIAGVIVGGSYWLFDWRYSGVIGNLESRIKLTETQRDDLRDKLKGAEAKAKIDALEATKGQAAPAQPIDVHPGFEASYREFAVRLGAPTQPPRQAGTEPEEIRRSALLVSQEHAIVLWIRRKLSFYRLKKTAGTWDRRPHAIEISEKEKQWWDDEFLRKQLDAPPNKTPPFAGIAVAWLLNPDDWKWTGWVEWSCGLDGTKVFDQEFAAGLIIGPFPTRRDLSEAQVFILFNDGSWEARRVSGRAPCL